MNSLRIKKWYEVIEKKKLFFIDKIESNLMFSGILDLFFRKEFKLEEAVEKFEVYDSWRDLEYNFSMKVR